MTELILVFFMIFLMSSVVYKHIHSTLTHCEKQGKLTG